MGVPEAHVEQDLSLGEAVAGDLRAIAQERMSGPEDYAKAPLHACRPGAAPPQAPTHPAALDQLERQQLGLS